jgi:TPR repeat protein
MRVLKAYVSNRHLLQGLVLVFILFTSVSYADELNDGIKAYQQKNFALAQEKWLPLAEKGHVLAQTLIGSLYVYGEGVARDDVIAAHWFQLAANGGSAQAQYNLAILYEKGWGLEQDTEQARKWFRKAADNGRKDAASRLIELDEIAAKTDTGASSDSPPEKSANEPLMPYTSIVTDTESTLAGSNPAWLSLQQGQHYTLQIAASIDRQRLEAILPSLPTGTDYAIVESYRGKIRWYALIVGSYASVQQARLAHNQLPGELSAWSPWIRPFSDLKSWRVLSGHVADKQ